MKLSPNMVSALTLVVVPLVVCSVVAIFGARQLQRELPAQAMGETTHHTVDHAFDQALKASVRLDYAQARTLWRQVLVMSPLLPEAWVNLGFASVGLGQAEEAIRQFNRALSIRPGQVNAYYGLALAAELKGDRKTALGAMRSFVHLANPDNPFVRRARSALWEWQS